MRSLGRLMVAIVMVTAGCGDDDSNIIVVGTDALPGDDVTVFRVPLVLSQEVPACAAASSVAAGEVTVSVPADNSAVTVTGLTFTGLSGPAMAAHIHAGARGVAGPIVFPLSVAVVPFSTVSFGAADYPSPVPAGAQADFPSFVSALRAGDTYVNVHTAACPSGEIRGQVQ